VAAASIQCKCDRAASAADRSSG